MSECFSRSGLNISQKKKSDILTESVNSPNKHLSQNGSFTLNQLLGNQDVTSRFFPGSGRSRSNAKSNMIDTQIRQRYLFWESSK